MRIILGLLFILGMTSACKKQTFTPCSEYNNLLGSWISIESDFPDQITFSDNGKYIFQPSFDRSGSFDIVNCDSKIGGDIVTINNVIWNYILLRIDLPKNENNGFLSIYHNVSFDTIYVNLSAENAGEDHLNYRRFFVKIN